MSRRWSMPTWPRSTRPAPGTRRSSSSPAPRWTTSRLGGPPAHRGRPGPLPLPSVVGALHRRLGLRRPRPEGPLDDDVIVCRCEEITAGEIRKAIRKYHATTVTEVKRRVRAGMGLCQGRTCGKLVSRIIAEETGKKMSEIQGSTDRPPVRPVTFGELAEDGEDQEG